MPENVNTTPLSTSANCESSEDNRPTMVKVDHVSMVFNMASEQLNSLKEYAIAIARRELMFKEFRALDNVSFEVKKGDVFGILGTNGSGKSTVLKIVAGVLEPTEGKCLINGSIAPLIELGAGFDMELTARENIYLNGALLGYQKKFIQQHFKEIVEFAEIEKFLDMPMKNYSSGMVARIAFAIATVIVPEILIVDEVLSVGDFMFQQKCERRILQLIKEHDVTVLIVSHNNDQIERLCNKAIWIEKGHTRMIGTAQDVCRTYRVLGGHVGSSDSENRVFEILNDPTRVPTGLIDTISGETRYGTAVKLIEKCSFDSGGPVIVAPGEHASSCMAACGLSGLLNAPVILTKSDGLPDVSGQELKRLNPSEIIVIENNENTVESLSDICGCRATISTISGISPAEIAYKIYKYSIDNGGMWGDTAIVTYDGCTGDLISYSPYIFLKKIPVFFSKGNGLVDDDTTKVLQSGTFKRLLALGGETHISDSFLEICRQNGTNTERICGKNPYHANELINNWISKDSLDEGVTIEHLIVSSVWNPCDAFSGGAYAGKTHSSFLLEDPQDLDSVAHALDYIEKKKGAVKHLTFLGDGSRFNKLDKEILGKAVARSISYATNKENS